MLISMFDFQYNIYNICNVYNIHNIYITHIYIYNTYIYIYIYIIIKHWFPIMVAHTYYYIYNCNRSFLHVLVVMCYLPKLKRGMASFFLTNLNIRPNFLINI